MTQAISRLYLAILLLSLPDMFSLIATFNSFMELHIVKREVKDNLYTPPAYVWSQALVQLPFMYILSLCANLPAAFGIANWPTSRVGEILLIWALKAWAMERLAMFSAVGVPMLLMALMQFMVCERLS